MVFDSLFGRREAGTPSIVPALPLPKPFHERMEKALDSFAVSVRAAGNILPTGAYSRLRNVDSVMRALLVHVSKQGYDAEQEFLISAIITDYLPTTVNTFLALNPLDRAAGSRSTCLLVEQCDTLEVTARDLSRQIREHAITELAAHAQFLKNTFAQLNN